MSNDFKTKVLDRGQNIITALNQNGHSAEIVLSSGPEKLLIISDNMVHAHVYDKLNSNNGQVEHYWEVVKPDFKSIMYREITGKPISFTPRVKDYRN